MVGDNDDDDNDDDDSDGDIMIRTMMEVNAATIQVAWRE